MIGPILWRVRADESWWANILTHHWLWSGWLPSDGSYQHTGRVRTDKRPLEPTWGEPELLMSLAVKLEPNHARSERRRAVRGSYL